MSQNKIVTIVVTGILLIFTSCTPSAILQSNWQAETSPNKPASQHIPAAFFSKDNDLTIKLTNNNTQLYVTIETNNPITVKKIVSLGMGLWIDPQGKSQRIMGINYPLPLDNPQFNLNTFTLQTAARRQQLYKQWFDTLEMVNMTPGETLTAPAKNVDDEISTMVWSTPQVLFHCQYRVPLKKIYPNEEKIQPLHIISIGINSVNTAYERDPSSLSSREVLSQKIKSLSAGATPTDDLTEQWISFRLAHPRP